MRLFTAVEIPDALRPRLAGLRMDLIVHQWGIDPQAHRVAFTPAANLHVTMKFLGEVAEQDVSRVCDALGRLPRQGPLLLCIDGLELFPPRGPIRIVAAKVGGDVERLTLVHDALEQACEEIGIAREARAFRPHVTLARARGGLSPNLRHSGRPAARNLTGDTSWLADALVLFESRLHRSSPEYIPVARFPI